MPVIEVDIPDGCPSDVIAGLVRGIGQAVRVELPGSHEAISVQLKVSARKGGVDGTKLQQQPEPSGPKQMVLEYLKLVEARDFVAAETFLSVDFKMVFPGNSQMHTLDDLAEWATPRYRFVTKSFDAVEAFEQEGAGVVYTRGTLAGAWLDGKPFEGIRFIDRFEVRNGQIDRQDVWNDVAEVRST